MTKPARSKSEIGRANLTKGRVAERRLVSYLRASGWPGAERTVRTGYRVAGGREGADQGDVDGTPGLVWQVKAVAETRHYLVPTWLAETAAQRDAAGADFGVLVVKRSRAAHPGQWWAYLPANEFARLAGGFIRDLTGPVRLELRDLVLWLRLAGYGTAGTAELAEEAS